MAAGSSISGIFAFINQSRQLYPQTASDIRTQQKSLDDTHHHLCRLSAEAEKLFARAQALHDELSRLNAQIAEEENRLSSLQTGKENDPSGSPRPKDLHQIQQHIDALNQQHAQLDNSYRRTLSVYNDVNRSIQTLSDTAAHLQTALQAKKGKCGAIASNLFQSADFLGAEAEAVQMQEAAFNSMASLRFGTSASHAAGNRSARRHELDQYASEAKNQAQLYQELADGMVSPATSQHRQAIARRLSGASNPYARSLYEKHKSFIRFENNHYEGTAHYNPSSGKISLHAGADAQNPKGEGTTYFHEVGHLIDHRAGAGGWLSSDPQYGQALKADLENYVSSVMAQRQCSIDEAYDIISDELTGCANHSISDMFGSMTGCQCQGDYGHSPGYWTGDADAFKKEAFAHMFEASIGSQQKQQKMQKYFPGAYAVFESMIRRA